MVTTLVEKEENNTLKILSQKIKKQNNTALILIFTISVSFFLLFWQYFKWLGTSWMNNPLDTFGYLTPFVSAWAVYSKGKNIRSLKGSSCSEGWFYFIPAVFLLIIYHWNNQALEACISLSLLLYGLSLTLLGRERTRYLVFPVFFLMFLYPWGDLMDVIIGYDLRRLSVLLAYSFYKIIGMDAAVSGTYLYTGRFLIDIAPACSGLTIMNVLLFIGAIGIYIYQGSLRNKIFIFISIFPLAVISNTIRIIFTGLIGHYKGEDTALGFYDNISGMLVFGISMLMLYGEVLVFKAWDKKCNGIK